MPVKVGASYVTEAAYEFAKARRAEKEEGKEEKGKGGSRNCRKNIPASTSPWVRGLSLAQAQIIFPSRPRFSSRWSRTRRSAWSMRR